MITGAATNVSAVGLSAPNAILVRKGLLLLFHAIAQPRCPLSISRANHSIPQYRLRRWIDSRSILCQIEILYQILTTRLKTTRVSALFLSNATNRIAFCRRHSLSY